MEIRLCLATQKLYALLMRKYKGLIMKKKLLFVITQFYKGGAETSLLNLFRTMNPEYYDVDFMVLNQQEHQNVTSLMEFIPPWIHVYDIVKIGYKHWRVENLVGKVYRRFFHTETHSALAEKIVKGEVYDAAFSFGEWLSPAFLANKVNAKRKYIWIHIDIDKASFVNKEELVKYDKDITGYIFASEKSRAGAIISCTQMADKSCIIHNFIDEADIMEKAEAELPNPSFTTEPYLLSVGNLRIEKNYPRQVEIMNLLKQRGIDIKWLCVGSTADKSVVGAVERLIERYSLQNDFILCGVDDNPYRYMKNATAVMVLSDYESWSLVISEAKLLGVPVIATNTSGAQEQLVDGENGIIVDFNTEHIVDKIDIFLQNMELQSRIRINLQNEEATLKGMAEFESLLNG